MSRRLAVVLGMGLLGIGWLGAPPVDAGTAPPTLSEAVAPSRIEQVALDPRGERIAVLLREARAGAPLRDAWGHSLWIHRLDDDTSRELLRSRSLRAVQWSTDGEVLFLETETRLGAVAAGGGRPSWILELEKERRRSWTAVDRRRPRHVLVDEVEPDPEDPDARTYRRLRVGADGTVEILLEKKRSFGDVLLDPRGRPAFLQEPAWDGDRATALKVSDLGEQGEENQEILRCSVVDSCAPLAHDEKTRTLWMHGRLDGDLRRLWQVPLDGGEPRVAHEDPEGIADLGPVSPDPVTGRPLVVSYETDRLRPYGVGPAEEMHAERLRRQFPSSSLRVSARSDGYWLLEETGARLQHARFHVYDPSTGRAREVLVAERATGNPLPPERLVDQRPVTWTARDGRVLHGYVWSPPGVDPRRAPVVALLHGGPWNRVRYGYNGGARYLAGRGWMVFQPNFRGSSGYGYGFMEAARGELSRGAVQHDILDGLEALAAAGEGDPERWVLVGHSYGGYAALAGSVHHGDRYLGVVATAAPIDLVRTFRDLDPAQVARAGGVPFRDWAEPLFLDLEDPESVAEERAKAPEAHVRVTSVPVLLVAGARDAKVDVVDVRHYASLLAEAGKEVTLVVDDEAGHSFESPRMREASFYLTERFLARWAGLRPGPVDPELEDYLADTIRLTAPKR